MQEMVLLSTLMASVMFVQFSNQNEDSTNHTNGKCHVFPLMITMLTVM